MNKIIRTIIPQRVKIRKYDVDVENLKNLLRKHKQLSKLTNKDISNILDKPVTLVEHWFRNDKSFSIPTEDIWYKLKNILKISEDEFDVSITTFEEKDGIYDKSNRVYDINGIAPTLTSTSAEFERFIVWEDDCMTKPKLVGGVGEINFGKQYRQGNRIYDVNEIAMCLMSQPVGSMGGYSYLYKVENKNIKNGVDNMWKNNLEKFNFKMDTVKVFDSFAGKGALHKSLKRLGVPTNIIGISEIDIDAIIAYAGVHIKGFKDLEFDYPSDVEMREWLMARNIGYSFEKQKSSIPRLKKDKLLKVYKASILLNNLGDISTLNYDNIPDFDLFNFSFPCTDISGAGKQAGLKNEDGTPTRSGLVKYGIEVVKAKRPKYIMIENVKALIQKKFIGDFYDIVNEIESYGYTCNYPTKEDKKGKVQPMCLNAKDFGIPQNRERIFVICVRKDVDCNNFNFPIGKDYGIRLKDLLEDNVEDKYYLSEEIQKRFKLNDNQDIERNDLNVVGSSAPDFRTIGQRDMTYGVNGVMSTLTATDYKQPKQILDTNSVQQLGNIVNTGNWDNPQRGRIYSVEGTSPTLNCCEGGGLEPKVVINNNKLDDIDYTVCEQRCDEGLRFFKDNICGSLRTIDACGDKRIIENNKFKKMKNPYDITSEYFQNNEFIEPIALDEQNRCIRKDFTVGTLTTDGSSPKKNNRVVVDAVCGYHIRKLTPLECWRLMGFDDEDFYNVKELGLSDSALYKLAGNSIVVNCLYYIFKELFKEYIIE